MTDPRNPDREPIEDESDEFSVEGASSDARGFSASSSFESEPLRVGRYPVEHVLGKGGMGVVLQARDPKLGRPVALKMLPDSLARDRHRLLWLEREARTLASMNHPNIATIYGLEETEDGGLFLVLELVEGMTLLKHIREQGALPQAEALRIAKDITSALGEAHERGIVHRDLKPGNVMITATGRVKVLDFGLAEPAAPPEPARGSRGALMEGLGAPPPKKRTVSGTRGYMSPEQALGQPQDKRTDIFAFGCVLFECLSGHRAFPNVKDRHPADVVLQDTPDFDLLPRTLPARVLELTRACLAPKREDRLADIGEARVCLEEILGGQASVRSITGAALARTPNNLPTEVTSFVGRERELAEGRELALRTRLLTLSGVGGCGKSRLAVRLARELVADHPDGIRLVELAPVVDPDRVARSVALVLGVKEEPGLSVTESLIGALGASRVLLVLDNCEHQLPAAGALVRDLLRDCPNLRVVATSREKLGVPGELIYQVPTLAAPAAGTDPGHADRYESVRLFAERAAFASPGFQVDERNAGTIMQICRRLDGIPLALELAAARVKLLTVEQIFNRLDDRFRLLTGGNQADLPHHQTLRATLEWSTAQLTPEEQQLLRRLAVFSGGWFLEGAVRIWGEDADEFEILDLLAHLVDKSLVMVEKDRGGSSRYGLLETVRQYAAEALDAAGEADAAREAHLACFLELAENAEDRLEGPEGADWLATLETEHDNLLGALRTCRASETHVDDALRLAGALWRFWYLHGHIGYGRSALTDALGRRGADAPTEARAKALNGAGALAQVHAEYDTARVLYEESLAIRRGLGDKQGAAKILNNLGSLAWYRGDLDGARTLYEESLTIKRGLGNKADLAATLNNLGAIYVNQGDYEAAVPLHEESLAIHRELKNQAGLALALHNQGIVQRQLGNMTEARRLHEESLAIERERGNKLSLIPPLFNFALVCVRAGDVQAAFPPLVEAFQLVLEAGDKRFAAYSLESLAALAHASARESDAARFLAEAEGLRTAIGSPRSPAEEREVETLRAQLGAAVVVESGLSDSDATLDRVVRLGLQWLGDFRTK